MKEAMAQDEEGNTSLDRHKVLEDKQFEAAVQREVDENLELQSPQEQPTDEDEAKGETPQEISR